MGELRRLGTFSELLVSRKECTDPWSVGIIHCRSEGILRLWSRHARPVAEETSCIHIPSRRRLFLGSGSFSPEAQREESPDAGRP